jgi:hypothetical protein
LTGFGGQSPGDHTRLMPSESGAPGLDPIHTYSLLSKTDPAIAIPSTAPSPGSSLTYAPVGGHNCSCSVRFWVQLSCGFAIPEKHRPRCYRGSRVADFHPFPS